MNQPLSSSRRLRKFGIIWIVLAPIVFLMAAISKVKSDATYEIQLLAFSAVAIAAFIVGVAAVLRQRWAAFGLMALSYLAAVFFFGSGIGIVAIAVLPGSSVTATTLEVLFFALVAAVPGPPFIFMAQRLRQLISEK